MNKASILIIDDTLKNIQLLANVLTLEGFNVEFGTSGAEALEWIVSKNFDLILLDIMMPEMDGIETCKRIKENPALKYLPIIFLTAKTEIEDIARAFEAGGVDYITKPFNNKELVMRINTHLTIKRQREELIQLNTTKDMFISVIAHDLRNPIGGIKSLAAILADESDSNLSEEQGEVLNLLQQASNSAFDLLNNLLEWARSQKDVIGFHPIELNLFNIVKLTIELFTLSLKAKKITIKNEILPIFPLIGDREMLYTILRNLINNAIKFTNEGGTIRVSARTISGFIEVEVRDSGVGMTQKMIDNINSLNDTGVSTFGTHGERGTGLGLILCKEFVEKHGGNIFIESEINKGTAIRFTLKVNS